MKKLLFSTICLGALCVGANADYYAGVDFGAVGTKTDDGESIGSMLEVNAYIRDYKESNENSSFVKSFKLGYSGKSKDQMNYYNFNAELLGGYGMHFGSSLDFSLNLLAGVGINMASVEDKFIDESVGIHTPYAKIGFSALTKFGESKQFGVTLDAYFNHYLDYDIIEDRKENFFSAELGALYKLSTDNLFVKVNVGTKDSLFSDKLNNIYYGIGLGYKF